MKQLEKNATVGQRSARFFSMPRASEKLSVFPNKWESEFTSRMLSLTIVIRDDGDIQLDPQFCQDNQHPYGDPLKQNQDKQSNEPRVSLAQGSNLEEAKGKKST